MVEREAQIVRVARVLAVASVAAALMIGYGFGANYLRFLQWSRGANANLTSAIARGVTDGGELSLEVEFEAPPVGYRAQIETMEFSLLGPEGNFGYYRVIVPEGLAVWEDNGVSALLSLYSHIPSEHWINIRASSGAELDGRLIVRLFLPGREVPARLPVSAPVSIGGGSR